MLYTFSHGVLGPNVVIGTHAQMPLDPGQSSLSRDGSGCGVSRAERSVLYGVAIGIMYSCRGVGVSRVQSFRVTSVEVDANFHGVGLASDGLR